MVFPAVNIHTYHSLQLYEGFDIIFDLHSIRYELGEIVNLIPNMLLINRIEKYITMTGYKLSDSRYMVNIHGDTITIPYTCSDDDILKGLDYLYQIYKNVILKSDDIQDNEWNPKPYKPE